jgi:small subunit ribosomal protein S16
VVKIRLKRMGTKKRPVYRIVVADSRSPRDGRFIEAIGFYDPLPNPAVVRIDEEKVRVWMRKGARPSESARFLLVRQGILAPLPRRERPAQTPGDGAGPAASGSPPAEAIVPANETEQVAEAKAATEVDQ